MAWGKAGAGLVEGSGANEAGAQASGMTDVAKPPPSQPEEPPMEIHKPKPVHSLREFLSEIVVIVCGVLIALGLEQAVEALHWGERVHEAKTAIHKELVLTTIFGEERIAWHACADAYLADLASAVATWPLFKQIGHSRAGQILIGCFSRWRLVCASTGSRVC
jgi:hypothetical protein